MGRIVSASHVSWAEDGSEEDGFGPVQGATRPWFELEGSGAEFTLHAGRGTWAGDFSLTDGAVTHDRITYDTDTYLTLTSPGGTARITRDLFDTLENDSAGPVASSRGYFSDQSGLQSSAGQLLVTQSVGQTLVVASMPGQTGLSAYRYDEDGQLVRTHTLRDTASTFLSDPVALAAIVEVDSTYVYAASGGETGISVFRINGAGEMNAVGDLLPEEGLWVSDITMLKATTVDGQPFLLVGAAGSGSLSVLSIGDRGRMEVVDHVLDDANTRFDDITVLETLVVGARTYVAASGGDDGFSLFSLLPNGQLLHLETLADTTALGLGSISALSLSVQDGNIHVIASSETEPGLTHIVYEPGGGMQIVGTHGADTLMGTGDADIILDGAGIDVMTGGVGADLFVLAADGVRDTILDFQIGVDRIDVSAWNGLYSTLQLEVRALPDGIDIRYGGEQIILRTHDGTPLALQDLLDTDVLGIARLTPHADRIENQTERMGTDTDDLLEGSAQDNRLMGIGGNDRLMGLSGNDTLEGGAGSDFMMGGNGHDLLMGGSAHDALYGGEGNDTLYGGTGADTLEGEGGNDMLWGDSSTDVLYGGDGADTLTGGVGADTLYGGDGDDRLLSNTGVDLIYGGAGNDWISPGNGVDIVYGEAGDDTIIGRTGWDTLDGGSGDDAIYGSEGRDALYGGTGHDFLSGGFGFDTLWGGDGNDDLYGNIGEDEMYGEAGNDRLYGATGNDILVGGDGDDELYGAQGRDTLEGGAGNDFLRGGTLGDTFIFDQGHGQDTVSGMDWLDQIHLSTALTEGRTDPVDIVQTYLRSVDGDAVLWFANGDKIIFDSDVTETDLIGAIFTF